MKKKKREFNAAWRVNENVEDEKMFYTQKAARKFLDALPQGGSIYETELELQPCSYMGTTTLEWDPVRQRIQSNLTGEWFVDDWQDMR